MLGTNSKIIPISSSTANSHPKLLRVLTPVTELMPSAYLHKACEQAQPTQC